MKIYTTCFENAFKLPDSILPFSIALKPPKNWNGFQYRALAPKEEFFYKWRDNRNNEYYTEHFNSEVLEKLDAKTVVEDLQMIAKGYDSIALVCYEQPTEFCHRHLIAEWLQKDGFEVVEFT